MRGDSEEYRLRNGLIHNYSCLGGLEISDLYRSTQNGHEVGCIVNGKRNMRVVDIKHLSYSERGPILEDTPTEDTVESILLLIPSSSMEGFRDAREENLLPGIVRWHPEIREYRERYWDLKIKEARDVWEKSREAVVETLKKEKTLEI